MDCLLAYLLLVDDSVTFALLILVCAFFKIIPKQISFPLEMGDNPAVSEGAPITMGWKPTERSTMDLTVYEYARKKEKRHRGKKLMIPAVEREIMLLSNGFPLVGSGDLLCYDIINFMSVTCYGMSMLRVVALLRK